MSGWPEVPGDELRSLVRVAWLRLREVQYPGKPIADALEVLPDERRAFLRDLLADGSAPSALRVFCAVETVGLADAAWREDVLLLLADLDGSRPKDEQAIGLLGDLARGLPSAQTRVALTEDLLRLDGLGEDVLSPMASRLLFGVRIPPALALSILERWGEWGGQVWTLLRPALEVVELSEDDPRLELVRRLLGNRMITVQTLQLLGRLHLDAHLPLLEGALLGQGYASEEAEWTWSVQSSAAQALACYLDDRAAEILLKGLGATTAEPVRQACFDALETIRRYQDEKERWAQRKGSQQARDAAIAELVPMLSDADANVRAQAARSMGALGAVEQLPALVRMLKDPVPEVRSAAQEAIGVLTAPEPRDG